MRTWTRASQKETICGGPCITPMRQGDPMFEIAIASRAGGKAITLRRCARCAGEAVPDNLPPLAERTPIVPTAHLRTDADALPFDYKLAAAGREPGEDG